MKHQHQYQVSIIENGPFSGGTVPAWREAIVICSTCAHVKRVRIEEAIG